MKKKKADFHQPALLKETINFLNVQPREIYLDLTVGGAGHAEAILKKGGRIFGLDRDPEAVNFARKRLQKACPVPNQNKARFGASNRSWQIIKENFINLEKILKEHQISSPAGILLDLGVSLHQLKAKGRGFSWQRDELLDMRMDPSLSVTAADLINGLYRGELNELFSRLAEEKLALSIAKTIILERQRRPIETTSRLAAIVSRVYQRTYRSRSRIHPATKVFQALRIAVNDELNNLKEVLPQALGALKKEGRLVVISFHGLEDKIVKKFFLEGEEKGWLEILTSKPIRPARAELRENPRARSGKLRAVQKK